MNLKEYIVEWHKKKTGKTRGAQAAFALATSTEPSLLSRHVTGVLNPEQDSVEKYAKVLGISPQSLRVTSSSKYPPAGSDRGQALREPAGSSYQAAGDHYLPVLGVINGPTFSLSKDHPAIDVLPLLVSPRYFAMRISERPLEPAFGQYLIATWADNIPEGETGIYSRGGVCTMREWEKREAGLKPVALVLGYFQKP